MLCIIRELRQVHYQICTVIPILPTCTALLNYMGHVTLLCFMAEVRVYLFLIVSTHKLCTNGSTVHYMLVGIPERNIWLLLAASTIIMLGESQLPWLIPITPPRQKRKTLLPYGHKIWPNRLAAQSQHSGLQPTRDMQIT